MVADSGVEMVKEWLSILEEIHQGQKELVNITRENAAKIDRTWPALARVEARILEIRRDVNDAVGELLGEIETNKKKLTSSGRKSRGWPMKSSSLKASRTQGQLGRK